MNPYKTYSVTSERIDISIVCVYTFYVCETDQIKYTQTEIDIAQ